MITHTPLQLIDLPDDEALKVEQETGAPSGLPKIVSTGFKVRVSSMCMCVCVCVCESSVSSLYGARARLFPQATRTPRGVCVVQIVVLAVRIVCLIVFSLGGRLNGAHLHPTYMLYSVNDACHVGCVKKFSGLRGVSWYAHLAFPANSGVWNSIYVCM